MKIWVDDIRVAAPDYVWCQSVNQAIGLIQNCITENSPITHLAIDHDAGEFYKKGGDYIKVLDYLEMIGYKNLNIKILTNNPYAAQKYRLIIQKNRIIGWQEI